MNMLIILLYVRRYCLLIKITTILLYGLNVIFLLPQTVIGIPLPVGLENVNFFRSVDRVKKSTGNGMPISDNSGESSRPFAIFSKNLCDDLKWSKKSERTNRSENLTWTESADKLMPLLDPSRYNRFEAPGQVRGDKKTKFLLTDFEVDTYLPLSWYDHRLAHNCAHPILITDLDFSHMLWQPDLYFVNSKFGFIHQVTTPNFMILVYNDGFVFKSQRINVLLSCLLKLQDFPMDEQHCTALMQSFAYIDSVLKLEWHLDENQDKGFPISYNPKLAKGLSDMFLVNKSTDNCDMPYPLFRGWGNWSCLRATIVMKRKLRFHLIQMFLPTAMLVCISWLSFWLDIRASPARISLTITTLLTLTTMSNGSRQDLPQVSYMKSIDKWVAACQAFVFSVLLEYTIVNVFVGYKNIGCTIHSREHTFKNEGHQKGPFLTAEIRKACPVCAIRYEVYAKRVDRVSRVLFPLGFAIFNMGYWWSYYNQWKFYTIAKLDDDDEL